MRDDSENFDLLMADLAEQTGQRVLRATEGDAWVVSLGDAVVLNLAYRPETGQVVTFAEVCPFRPMANGEDRARLLLELNWQWKDSQGFTVSVDDGTGRLMIADRRASRRFTSVEALGAYLARAASLVRDIRQGLVDFGELAMAEVDGELARTAEEKEEESEELT